MDITCFLINEVVKFVFIQKFYFIISVYCRILSNNYINMIFFTSKLMSLDQETY